MMASVDVAHSILAAQAAHARHVRRVRSEVAGSAGGENKGRTRGYVAVSEKLGRRWVKALVLAVRLNPKSSPTLLHVHMHQRALSLSVQRRLRR